MKIFFSAKSLCGRLAVVWLASLMTMTVSRAQFEKEPPAPFFSGTMIPSPPQQGKPWTAPESALPPDAGRVAKELFEDGLADPRGCEYREVEIAARELPVGVTVKTHGWVLPETEGGQRFVVAWDGLVHPAISVGEKADLAKDVAAKIAVEEEAMRKDRERHESQQKKNAKEAARDGEAYEVEPWEYERFGDRNAAAQRMSAGTLYPINVALLLRLGEAALAEQAWKTWYKHTPVPPAQELYAAWASDWIWALYDQAVNSHAQADDHLALASARALGPFAAAAQARVGKAAQEQFAYLNNLPELLADQERRASEPARQPALDAHPPLEGKELTEALIRNLDLVNAQQMMQPGDVNLLGDEIVQGLVRQGEDAVEPLLSCLETDQRLTRSVRVWRYFAPSRTILGTREAAYVALANILNKDFFTTNWSNDSLTARGNETSTALARIIREYWEKNRGTKIEERWYEQLADDQATPEIWKEAAANIATAAGDQLYRSSMGSQLWTPPRSRASGESPALRGEALRQKTSSSVSELLVRRMETEPSAKKRGLEAHLDNKLLYALALATWDGAAHLDLLRAFTKELRATLGKRRDFFHSGAEGILQMFTARLELGDESVLAEYAAWLPTLKRDRLFGLSESYIFRIMWRHPDNPAIRQAAKALFASKGSRWLPLIGAKGQGNSDVATNSYLLGIPEFRTAVFRGLGDKSVKGSVLVKDGDLMIDSDRGGGSSRGAPVDPFLPPEGEKKPVRACDLYAYELSEIDGFPAFQVFWPKEKKDAAIAEITAFLRREGDFLRCQNGDDERFPPGQASLHLPQLTAPATAEDVEQGRAIFALEGERRVLKLPAFPLEASWTTLKTSPYMREEKDPSGHTTKTLHYSTQGKVFQAEEVLVNGKWERYFGFAGPGTFAKAPATEIEFPDGYAPQRLSQGFEASLKFPEFPGDQFEMRFWGDGLHEKVQLAPAGKPVKVVVQLRNSRGLDQAVPGALLRPAGSTKGSLPQAVRLSLSYLEKAPRKIEEAAPAEWKDIPLRAEVTTAPAQSGETVLSPAQSQILLEGDLRDYFDLSKPGTYRLTAKFETPGGPEGKVVGRIFRVGK